MEDREEPVMEIESSDITIPEESMVESEDPTPELEDDHVNEEQMVEVEPSESPEDDNTVLEAEDDEQEDEENDNKTTTLQVGRIKRIMKICLATNEKVEDDSLVEKETKTTKKGKKGNAKSSKKDGSNKNVNVLVSKEAVYLTAMATELFITAISQQSSKITAATNKKTMTVEHLKRALSDSEPFEFLQGCFQPSILIE